MTGTGLSLGVNQGKNWVQPEPGAGKGQDWAGTWVRARAETEGKAGQSRDLNMGLMNRGQGSETVVRQGRRLSQDPGAIKPGS